ncbi:CAP domain-containing protein [Lactobacillus sp. Sy-1]|uniref:CAP domain-containing protein n=1 Tax=Lactobacillus sp. Sy-1 TaxID=2109645 RepID=UPI001C575A7B|nr:CAP domain-containing protein [Lactobacillus sp. Sy-1]MBW1605157.1 CAP domain-containing protein [Lactobacillus sp. Sy-1]
MKKMITILVLAILTVSLVEFPASEFNQPVTVQANQKKRVTHKKKTSTKHRQKQVRKKSTTHRKKVKSTRKAKAKKAKPKRTVKKTRAKQKQRHAKKTFKKKAVKKKRHSKKKATKRKTTKKKSTKKKRTKKKSTKTKRKQKQQPKKTQSVDPNAFNPAKLMSYLPVLKNGHSYQYNSDNNRYVLKNFPTKDTDDSSLISNITITDGSNPYVKLLKQRDVSWGVRYYLVRFQNGEQGWVQNQDLHPLNYLAHTINRKHHNYKSVEQDALDYINYLRSKHHLGKLKFDYRLNQIAAARVPQLPASADHFNASGVRYRNVIASNLGYQDLVNNTGENVAKTPDYAGRSVKQGVLQNLNAMMFEDGGDSKWGHRDNILDASDTKIGIGINSKNGMILIAYIFGS